MKQKEAIALIKEYSSRWSHRLGLGWWWIDLVFYDDPDTILDHFGNDGDKTVLAQTFVEWKYGTAKILFNAPAWKKLDKEAIERAVLHELCHILVNEMREGELHHEERVVTGLQKAFMWTEADVIKTYNPNAPLSILDDKEMPTRTEFIKRMWPADDEVTVT